MRIDRAVFAAALATSDMTIAQLSQMTGISRVTISSVKGGKSCSRRTYEKLLAVLGPQIESARSAIQAGAFEGTDNTA